MFIFFFSHNFIVHNEKKKEIHIFRELNIRFFHRAFVLFCFDLLYRFDSLKAFAPLSEIFVDALQFRIVSLEQMNEKKQNKQKILNKSGFVF